MAQLIYCLFTLLVLSTRMTFIDCVRNPHVHVRNLHMKKRNVYAQCAYYAEMSFKFGITMKEKREEKETAVRYVQYQ